MFENKTVNGIYYSRIIMSWVRAGGKLEKSGKGYHEFELWLKALSIPEEDIKGIIELAQNGKMELELSAKNFIATLNT